MYSLVTCMDAQRLSGYTIHVCIYIVHDFPCTVKFMIYQQLYNHFLFFFLRLSTRPAHTRRGMWTPPYSSPLWLPTQLCRLPSSPLPPPPSLLPTPRTSPSTSYCRLHVHMYMYILPAQLLCTCTICLTYVHVHVHVCTCMSVCV